MRWGSKTPGHPENFETEGIEALGAALSGSVWIFVGPVHVLDISTVRSNTGAPV